MSDYTLKTGHIYLVGAGKMGGALLEGWVNQGIDPAKVSVLDPNIQTGSSAFIQERSIKLNPDLDELVKPDFLVLAVKPQVMDQVLSGLGALLHPDITILSIAAGSTIASLAKHVGEDTAIVRAMPNTPASVGCGMTVAVANAAVTPRGREVCHHLMSAVGEVEWVEDESLMDPVTAVSGSGPAYVFYLVECLAEAGRKAGLEGELAMQLARQTIIGAGELLHYASGGAAELRRNVASPGGTTEAALKVLMADEGLQALMDRTVEAANKRSKEL